MPGTKPLKRSALWNLVGQAAPIVVAVFAIPALVRGLGAERFGVLAMAWVLTGYMSLFDLGVGRALTRVVAERRGTARAERLADLTWTALGITFVLGAIATLAGLALAGPLADRVLRVPPELRGEVRRAMAVLALSLPFVLSTAGLRGILEAHLRFGLANAIRAPLGVWQFLAPLATLLVTRDLSTIVLVLVAGRVAAWVAHLAAAFHVMPELRRAPGLVPAEVVQLVREGGWMTVSNVVGPVMVYLDRFLLGAMVSMAAVAWYATPFEVVTRLLVIPGAIAGVLFPAFAQSAGRPERVGELHARGVAGILLLLFPPVLVLSAFAPELLRAWVGEEFAIHGTFVLRWIALGVLVNGVAQVPFTALQASGRPRATALLHLVETPVYVAAVWLAVRAAATDGAAAAWTGRVAVDAVALFAMARAWVPGVRGHDGAWLAAFVAALAALAAVDLVPGLATRGAIAAVALVAFALVAWTRLLGAADRDWIRARVAAGGGR